MREIAGRYYDGKTSEPHDVRLRFYRDGEVRILGLDQDRVYRLAALDFAPRVGNIPRAIQLPDGGRCEAPDNDAVDEVLRQQRRGGLAGLVHLLETRARFVVLSLVLSVVTVWAGIQFGIPALSKSVAYALPPSAAAELGDGVLQALDKLVFEPSTLESARREQLRMRFANMTRGLDPTFRFDLVFRRSPSVGPNAFALPNGTIVVTDDLVNLAEHEDEIVAVLAHEVGHVVGRHALRRVLQNSGVMLLAAAITGDVVSIASLAGAVPTLLIESKYSRAFETEADDYALVYLQGQSISPQHLINILSRLEDVSASRDGALGYLSSHPATNERIERLHRASKQGQSMSSQPSGHAA